MIYLYVCMYVCMYVYIYIYIHTHKWYLRRQGVEGAAWDLLAKLSAPLRPP